MVGEVEQRSVNFVSFASSKLAGLSCWCSTILFAFLTRVFFKPEIGAQPQKLTSSWAVAQGVALSSPCLAMNVIQEIKRINERELKQGVSGKASWHHEYKDSAWVFAGGFPYDLTEGDVICVMSQWGEIEDINLCREKDTGKSKVTSIMAVLMI